MISSLQKHCKQKYDDTLEIGQYWLIILWSPGNRVGTVELIEGGALDAGDGGEGGGQHRHQKKKKKQHHFPEKQHINHGKATVLRKASGVFATVSKLKICL